MKARTGQPGFTLVELLVVVAILSLLLSMLMPSLGRARDLARKTVCKSQLNGLVKANQMYAEANAGHYVPAAKDIFAGWAGNLHRWHGVREAVNKAFDSAAGPLAMYLGGDGQIKQCPSFVDFRTDAGAEAYESGSGGYGYSDLYVGSEFWQHGFYHDSPGQLRGAAAGDVKSPAATVMFTDAAMPRADSGGSFLVEESFAYCPYNLPPAGQTRGSPRQPSIHFRHLERVCVGWVDGHVGDRDDFRSMAGRNVYKAVPADLHVGWFGPDDNSLFDLE